MTRHLIALTLVLSLFACSDDARSGDGGGQPAPTPDFTGTFNTSGTLDLSGPIGATESVGDGVARIVVDGLVERAGAPSFIEDQVRGALEAALLEPIAAAVDSQTPPEWQIGGEQHTLLTMKLAGIEMETQLTLNGAPNALTGTERITAIRIPGEVPLSIDLTALDVDDAGVLSLDAPVTGRSSDATIGADHVGSRRHQSLTDSRRAHPRGGLTRVGEHLKRYDGQSASLARQADGQLELLDHLEGLEEQDVYPGVHQDLDLFREGLSGRRSLGSGEAAETNARRPDAPGHIRPPTGDLTRDSNRGPVYGLELVHQTVLLELESTRPEGVGGEHPCAGAEVLFVNRPDHLGLLEGDLLKAPIEENTALIEHGAHGAVEEQSSLVRELEERLHASLSWGRIWEQAVTVSRVSVQRA